MFGFPTMALVTVNDVRAFRRSITLGKIVTEIEWRSNRVTFLLTVSARGEDFMADCNDAIESYTTTIKVVYSTNQTACNDPTNEEEAKALHAAKNLFKVKAEKYCEEGNENCPSDPRGVGRFGTPKRCEATVKIISAENEGIVSATPTADVKRECFLKFKITGSIKCACKPKPPAG
jgi:hypothetical protein